MVPVPQLISGEINLIMAELSFHRSSVVTATAEEVLSSLTMKSVNAEMRPLARMTVPTEWADRPILEWPTGVPLFNSWILLLGILPVDRHSVCFRSITPGKGFAETSTSLLNSSWHHQRVIAPCNSGCRIADAVTFRCRLPLLGYLLRPLYTMVFRRRHQQLRTRFAASIDLQ